MQHFYKNHFLGFILLIFTLLSSSCAGLFIHRTEKFKDRGSFEVSSVPPGADVVLNGKVVGKTPMKVALRSGLHLLTEKKDNTLVVYKEGYRKQNFVLKPTDEKTKYFRKGLGWIGFGELLGGLALSIAGFGIHEPNTKEPSLTGMGVSGLGFITFLSGLADMHTAKEMRPSSKWIRTYGNDVYVTLESNVDYERKIAQEKKEREEREERALRIEKERLEYERQVAEAIAEGKRKAAIEKEEQERKAEIAREERKRKLARIEATTGTSFAGIDVGSKGVKLAVLTFNRGYDGKIWFHPEMEKTKNTDVISGTISAINETAMAVKSFADSAQQKFNIPMSRLLIVISSGAMQELKKKDKVGELAIAIRTAFGNNEMKIYFITPEYEGILTAVSLIPKKEIDKAVVIDIGSGNTKGGYFADNSYKNFEAITFSFGTKSLAKEIKALNPTNFADFGNKAESYFKDKVIATLNEEFERKPAILNRNTLYLSGGIAWAINSIMHPENVKEEYSHLKLADVEAFKQKVLNEYDKLFEVNLTALSPDVSAEAEKNITNVRNTFDRESLLAGTMLLHNIMKSIEQQSGAKDYQFYKYSAWAWINSLVLLEYADQVK